MIKYISVILPVLFITACGFSGKTPIKQAPFGNDDALNHAQLGISIKNCATGETVASYNENASLHPASVLKVLTTATAIEVLGPEFKFETKLKYSGKIKEGVLHGNLIIEGGGDPCLGSSYFPDQQDFIQNWISALKQKGIKTIKGDIIAAYGIYDDEAIPSRWIWEDIGNYYGAGTYGLSVFDNAYKVYFRSTKLGQKAKVALIEPEIPGLEIRSEVTGSKNNKDSAYIFGGPQTYRKIIRGTIPANKMDFSIRGAMPNPPQFLANYFKQQLLSAGFTVDGKEYASPLKEDGNAFYTMYSGELPEVLKIINKRSNNQYAEHTLKMLSPQNHGKTSAKGIQTIKKYWEEKNMDISGLFMFDGSGLAPGNAINAKLLTDVLIYMRMGSRKADTFMSTLPKAGIEGTVSGFLKSSILKGKVWAKSGSMDNVKCYTGYMLKDDTPYAFSILVNQYNGPSDKIVKLVESYLENIYLQL